ncbi:hypothetical protein EG329_002869 [Mollisiaceae sp. DMI_Dod_QoI]|nr:hypothetical protein EG329_002869 [Helotiales sp. DMI_Dod_QoI]
MTDLETAIQRHQEALDRTPIDHPEQAGRLESLGNAYRNRYLDLGAMADLETAIQRHQEALDRTPIDHPEQAGRLERLGNAYHDRYLDLGAIADLETAIQRHQEALDRTPIDHPEQAGRLESLGSAYRDRYLALGAMADLDTAIQLFQEALDKTPADHPDRASQLQDLGAGYNERYQATGAMADLDTAIQRYQEALDKTSGDHPDRGRRLHNLGVGYGDKYQATGAMADLDTAIQRFQEALDKTSADHPNRVRRLHNLGVGYGDRYQATGAMADLDTAIQQYQEAFDRTPVNHPDRGRRLQSLGIGYGNRYQATRVMADLDTAIQLFQEALDKTPANYPNRDSQLQDLGAGYNEKYQVTGVIADLDTAIQLFQEALDRTPIDHLDRGRRLQYLAIGYGNKYKITKVMADLDTAIQQFQEALDRTPADHPGRASRLRDLGAGYRYKYQATGVMADLKTAIQRFQEALDQSSCPVKNRLGPGKFLFALHAYAKNWPEAFQTAFETVSLVPSLTPRFLAVSDKQRILVDISGLASDAAAVALNAGKTPFDAIQLLELGREVIAGSLIDIRADISVLQQKYPQLAKEYINLRNQLDAPKALTQHQIDQRYNAGQQLEEKIQTIRTLPGYNRFLLAPSENELRSAAEYGPIVIINISEYRCDALIIENSRLRSLDLPRLHSSDIRDHMMGNLAAPKILEWLWETVAQPVFNALGFTQPSSDDYWPRVWWIPTGPLSKFPLHAAGRHTNGSTETVLDRVISSYSSSVKAIIHGRRQRCNREGMQSNTVKALFIAPGNSGLPFAAREVEILRDLCGSMTLESIEPGRRKHNVISHLPHCDIFHFAGHGYTDDDDPSKSYLLLEDGKSDALTVANLLELNLRGRSPFLAYLSACGTGRIKGEKFVDENIHLISAFQLAGYRHVIGTLWEVKDEICVDMARITYKGIRDRGMTDESVAWGLHKAARELRDRWLSMPVKAERGSKLAREEDTSLGVDEVGARSVNNGDQRETRLLRDIVSCDDDDKEVGLWVPYVHFGV